MNLNELHPAVGAHPVAKRVGRGIGSGLGKTCGKGHKGQKSRSGVSIKAGFEGGQMPLYRRLPKFGFSSRKTRQIGIGLKALSKLDADIINYDVLLAARLLRPKDGLRVKVILSAGDFDKKITLKGIAASAGARKAIEAAGGKVE